jgi:hypothetical protein
MRIGADGAPAAAGSDALTLLSPAQLAVELDAGVLAMRAPPVPVTRTIGITTRQGWRPTRRRPRSSRCCMRWRKRVSHKFMPAPIFISGAGLSAQEGDRWMPHLPDRVRRSRSTFAKAAGWEAGALAYDINPRGAR